MKKIFLTTISTTILLTGLSMANPSTTQTTKSEKKMTTTIEIAPGLQYKQTKAGTGDTPKNGDNVSVHYIGTLTDGTKFDSSRDRGEPIPFTLGVGQVIQGWDKGIATMKVGERGVLTISPELGYGDHGAGAMIPGGATLLFDVELVSINK